MASLRWILLGAGIALILGLWWWETRKSRLGPQAETAAQWSGASDAPGEDAMVMDESAGDRETETAYVPTIERARVPRRPPQDPGHGMTQPFPQVRASPLAAHRSVARTPTGRLPM